MKESETVKESVCVRERERRGGGIEINAKLSERGLKRSWSGMHSIVWRIKKCTDKENGGRKKKKSLARRRGKGLKRQWKKMFWVKPGMT